MTVLRWLNGLSCAIALAFFVLVLIVGKGIRSAYQSGSGVTDVVRESAVYGIFLLIGAMLVSVFLPNSRTFLHVVAAGVCLAILGCLILAVERPGEGVLYLGFFALWIGYYVAAAWSKGGL